MGRVPVRLREVQYALSPFEQDIMSGLWKDASYKITKKITENWASALTLVVPVVGTYWYAGYYKEQEKLHHRY